MTWVKICGNRTARSAIAAAEAGADAVGFVFVAGQRRYVAPATAGEISHALPPRVERIGIFVDQTVEQIARVYDQAGLSGVQLHGGEGPAAVAELRRRLGPDARIIKAWRVRASEAGGSPPALDEYPPGPHLVEGFQPGTLGGSGHAWDWRYLAALAREYPERSFILAGGLRPDTVAAAIAAVHPWGVDVSSGVERDGEKDPDLIRAFVITAKSAAAQTAAARREEGSA